MTLPSRGQSREFKELNPQSLTDNIQKIFMFLVRKRIYLGEEKVRLLSDLYTSYIKLSSDLELKRKFVFLKEKSK